MTSLWLLIAFFVLLATACVPQTQTDPGPSVAVINAPTDFRAEGLADKLKAELERSSAPWVYRFVNRSKVEFQETHRDMAGGRAPLQAAFIARTFGAKYAVIVSAPIFEREVDEFTFLGRLKREITTEVQLEASIIDPITSEVLLTYTSPVYKGIRVEFVDEDEDLVDESKDPDLQASIDKALTVIAPSLATDLEVLFSRQVSSQ